MWTVETLRAFEEEIKELYLAGKIHAPVHLIGGNEEQVIEIFKGIRETDWCFSTYRSHYHALLKGVPHELVKAEILAEHSMHLNFKKYNFFTSSIAGGCLPIALGVAMAIKMKSEDRKVYCFIGDMASYMGISHEVKTYAKNFDLPLIIVVEDNGWSVQTQTREVWGIKNDPLPEGEIKIIEKWESGKVLYYRYERVFPHQGIGVFVYF